MHNEVLFKNHLVIVPKLLRAEILPRIHSSHLGTESCLRKARDVVFWPGMSSEIKESVAYCQICADFQARILDSHYKHTRSQTDPGGELQLISSVFMARTI